MGIRRDPWVQRGRATASMVPPPQTATGENLLLPTRARIQVCFGVKTCSAHLPNHVSQGLPMQAAGRGHMCKRCAQLRCGRGAFICAQTAARTLGRWCRTSARRSVKQTPQTFPALGISSIVPHHAGCTAVRQHPSPTHEKGHVWLAILRRSAPPTQRGATELFPALSPAYRRQIGGGAGSPGRRAVATRDGMRFSIRRVGRPRHDEPHIQSHCMETHHTHMGPASPEGWSRVGGHRKLRAGLLTRGAMAPWLAVCARLRRLSLDPMVSFP